MTLSHFGPLSPEFVTQSWRQIGTLSDPSRTFGPSEFSTWPIEHPWAPGALLGLPGTQGGTSWDLLGTSLGLLGSIYIHKLPINRTSGRYLYEK